MLLLAAGWHLFPDMANALRSAPRMLTAWTGDAPGRDSSLQAAPPAESFRLRVIDGDTVEIRGTQERVRIANIDTPESGERARCAAEDSAAARATAAARDLVGRAMQTEIVRTGRIDRYGRTVGFILVDGRDLGALLIAAGHARPWQGSRRPWCAANGALIR